MFTLDELKATFSCIVVKNHVYFGHCSFTIMMLKKEKASLPPWRHGWKPLVYRNHLLTLKTRGQRSGQMCNMRRLFSQHFYKVLKKSSKIYMHTVFFLEVYKYNTSFLKTISPCLRPKAPKRAKKKATEGNSNVFSMFEQSQIQEFKEVGLL